MVNRVLMDGRQPQASAAGHGEAGRPPGRTPLRRREQLDEALDVAAALNSRRIAGIRDLLGEEVTDLSGASHAVAEYVPPTDYRYPHMGG